MRLRVDYDSASYPLLYFFPSLQFTFLQNPKACLEHKNLIAHRRLPTCIFNVGILESDVIVFKFSVFTVTCTMKRTHSLDLLI